MPRTSSTAPFALALLAMLLSPPAARAADPAGAPPRIVHLFPLEGLPGDSLVRAEFTAGFDSVFAESALAVERADGGGEWREAGSRANRFVATDSTDAPRAGPVWTAQVVVGPPPPYVSTRRNSQTRKTERYVDTNRRASRGMTLAVLVLSPEAIKAGARAMPEHYAFSFPPESAPATVLETIPTGFLFPWREAGAVSAVLALELLHQRSGDFPTGTRCSIDPAQRAAPVR
jgi:hypothetical protein